MPTSRQTVSKDRTRNAGHLPAGLRHLRLFHLALAALAIAAYLSGEEWHAGHAWIGYGVGALLIVRLVLGLVAKNPWGLRRWMPHTRAALGQTGVRHPAISRTLILLVLSSVITATVTGIMMDEGRTLIGASARPAEGSEQGAAYRDHEADDREEDDREHEEREGDENDDGGTIGEVHELASKLMLLFVGIHVAYLFLFRRSQAGFMLFWPRRAGR